MKFTKTRIKIIFDAIKDGFTEKEAYGLAGIGESTYFGWKKKNESFRSEIDKKRLEFESSRVERIRKAGEKGQWQADAWTLERLRPEKYSERRRIEIDAEPFLKIIEAPEKEIRKVMEGEIIAPKELSEPKKTNKGKEYGKTD